LTTVKPKCTWQSRERDMESFMKKKSKKSIIYIIAIFAIVLICIKLAPTAYFLYLIGPPWQGFSQAEKDFLKNRELIDLVTNYLADLKYDNVSSFSWNDPSILTVSDEPRTVPVLDYEISAAMEALERLEYGFLGKYNDGIYFEKRIYPSERAGIVYSLDEGAPKHFRQYVEHISPLSENWFYYTTFLTSEKCGETIEKEFRENYDLFNSVMDHIKEVEYRSVLLVFEMKRSGSFMKSISDSGHLLISDRQVSDAVGALRKRGYSSAKKMENCISFVRWSGKDVGKGIAFSVDGSVPSESAISFLTKTKPMTDDGWFYYEADFNKWRRRGRADGGRG
jgi:hypothetical protein